MNNDLSNHLREQVATAFDSKTPVCISAGKSKSFYGNKVDAQAIDITEHNGIIDYQPSELVVTVRSGTKLSELEDELKANKQMLAFEPPQHNTESTIGGVIACGLSGPGRAAFGSARDFVLGTTIINGKAEVLKFGGQVMKNVAGYDASRLMVAAQGTLGIMLDISIKVLPKKDSETSVCLTADLSTASISLQQWVKQGLPITASCWLEGILTLRLGSSASAIEQSLKIINKQFSTQAIDADFWLQIKNQTHAFFRKNQTTDSVENSNADSSRLWRCSHQPATEFYGDSDNQLVEWNGALRWMYSSANLHATAEKYGGHATQYPINAEAHDESNSTDIFQPLQPAMLKLQQRLKQAFDPENILNPERLYTEL